MTFKYALFFLIVWANMHATAPHWEVDDPSQGWNHDSLVLEYFHHSELQRQWAWQLIGPYPLNGNERILDFGCGDGKITAELSHCLPNGQILGVDLSDQMLHFARRAFPKENFPHLSFALSPSLDFEAGSLDSEEKFDRI